MFAIFIKTHILIYFVVLASQDAPEVKIDQGFLKGKYQQTWKGRTFNSFTSIPYAEPPVDDLRFKAPISAGPWKGVLDATKTSSVCPQMNVYFKDYNVIGDEDCLYLNVYTPQLPSSNKPPLAVMFYIHGGGWMCGSASWYGPNILLDKDIVLVTINYRLGPLGFLSTGDQVVPGNNGLKDQNLALKWAKQNIARFGGDPESITVFGQSAGGASTHYHMLSPLSKDLIKGAIAQSGTTLGTWGLTPKGNEAKNTKRLAEFLNCPITSSQQIVDCLMKIDAHEIIKQDTKFLEWSYDPMIPFRPVIEPNIEGAFLVEDPIDIIKAGKAANIPLMTGLTSEDGALKSAHLYNSSKLIKELNKDFNKIAPYLFVYDETASDKDYISKKIREFYLKDREIDDSTKSEITDMITDGWFLLPEDAAVQLHLKYSKQPTYYFLFGYRGSVTYGSLFGDPNHDYGVCHCDELLYLFDFDFFKNNEINLGMIDIMTTLWTNFAKTGNPTPDADLLFTEKWKSVQSEKLEYYSIKSETDMKMAENLYIERAKFWRNLPLDSRRVTIRDEL